MILYIGVKSNVKRDFATVSKGDAAAKNYYPRRYAIYYMKKRTLFALILVILSLAMVLSSCKDPLESKFKEMDAAYAEMGNAYYRANYLAHLSGKVGNKDASLNDAKMEKQLKNWKPDIKDAKDAIVGWLDLSGEEMDQYIEHWKEVTQEMYAFCEQFAGVESNL